MPNPQPKAIYKQKQYIFGPRTGRIHLDDGALATDDEPTTEQPWWQRGQNLAPGMAGVTEDQLNAPAPAAPLAPPPVVEDDEPKVRKEYTDALAAQKEWNQYKPERGQPKWWQRALSGALGGAAGYVNAAGRIKHPIDTAQATENILHPGYQGRLQDWQSRADALAHETGLEGQLQNAQMNAEKIAAQAAARRELAASRREMSDPLHNTTPIPEDYARENYPWLMKSPDGKYHLPNKVLDNETKQVRQTADRGVSVADPDAARFLGTDPSQPIDRDLYKVWLTHKAAMELVDKKPTNVRQDKIWLAQQAAAGDPQAKKALDILAQNTLASRPPQRPRADPNAPKPFTTKDQQTLQAQKDTALMQLAAKTDAAMRGSAATGTPSADMQQRIKEDEAMEAANIQARYESEIATRTGNAITPFNMYAHTRQRRDQIEAGRQPPPPAGQAARPAQLGVPTQAPPPPVVRGKLTDPAVAQQYLQRANGDRNKARQLAQQDGWSF